MTVQILPTAAAHRRPGGTSTAHWQRQRRAALGAIRVSCNRSLDEFRTCPQHFDAPPGTKDAAAARTAAAEAGWTYDQVRNDYCPQHGEPNGDGDA